MAVYVIFQDPEGSTHIAAPCVGDVRATEAVATSSTGSVAAQNGEMVFLISDEATTVMVAHGSTPDASATTATAATTAAYPVPPRTYVPVKPKTGDVFAVA